MYKTVITPVLFVDPHIWYFIFIFYLRGGSCCCRKKVSHIVLRAWLREVSIDCRLIVFSDVPFPWWWLLQLNSEMEPTIISKPSLSQLLSFKLSSYRTQMFYQNKDPLGAALTTLLLLPVLGLSANKKPLTAERRRYLDILGQIFQLSMWLSAQNHFFFFGLQLVPDEQSNPGCRFCGKTLAKVGWCQVWLGPTAVLKSERDKVL